MQIRAGRAPVPDADQLNRARIADEIARESRTSDPATGMSGRHAVLTAA
jgi:hypothetical protein